MRALSCSSALAAGAPISVSTATSSGPLAVTWMPGRVLAAGTRPARRRTAATVGAESVTIHPLTDLHRTAQPGWRGRVPSALPRPRRGNPAASHSCRASLRNVAPLRLATRLPDHGERLARPDARRPWPGPRPSRHAHARPDHAASLPGRVARQHRHAAARWRPQSQPQGNLSSEGEPPHTPRTPSSTVLGQAIGFARVRTDGSTWRLPHLGSRHASRVMPGSILE